MNFKRSKVEGKMVDVVSIEDLQTNPQLYATGSVAVEVESADKVNYILPYRPNVNLQPGADVKPGVYNLGSVGNIIYYPDQEDIEEYQPEVIDLSNSKSMEEFISKQGKLKEIEKEILTTQDDIFRPIITDDDTPEMRALKTAVIQKHIDLDKYADRFGENYPNDKRKFKDNSISLMLLKRFGENLDMNIEIKISDANPNVPNPMGNPIVIQLTNPGVSGDDNSEDN